MTTNPPPNVSALHSCRANLLASWLDITNLQDPEELNDKIGAAINECERLSAEQGRTEAAAR